MTKPPSGGFVVSARPCAIGLAQGLVLSGQSFSSSTSSETIFCALAELSGSPL